MTVEEENARLRRLLDDARHLMIWAAPDTDEGAWWVEVDDVLGGGS